MYRQRAITPNEFNTKEGMVILNPKTVDIDWSTVPESRFERFILPADMKDKPAYEIAEYLSKNLKDRYILPGIEYYEYLSKNPEKAPQFIKDFPGADYHLFGTIFVNHLNKWGYLNITYGVGTKPIAGQPTLTRIMTWDDYVILLKK